MSTFAMKWGKKDYEVTIDGTTSPAALMQQVEQLTGVPVGNQKIMAKKGWKGVLSNDTKLKVKPGKIDDRHYQPRPGRSLDGDVCRGHVQNWRSEACSEGDDGGDKEEH